MKQYLATIFGLALGATSAFADDTADLQKLIREMRQEIDALSREVEALKNNQQKPTAVAEATTTTYGLGAAASKVYRTESGVSFGGYGEFTYEDARGEKAVANLERAVLYTGYKFSPRTIFNSELEVEDATTEGGGNVSIEFATLDFMLRPEANVRAGLVLVPMGLLNEQHEPTAYFGVQRPLTERFVIPSTWSDLGAGVFGDRGNVSYRAFVMTGLNSGGFDDEEGVREGRQKGSHAIADNPAIVGRADFHPLEGTMIGGSLYASDITLGEVHADARFRGVTLRGLIARGRLGNDGPAADLRSSIGGWYAEAGYELPHAITPYARYERLTLRPSEEDRITTFGVAYKPISQIVLKADYVRTRERNRQFNLGLGYIF